MIYNIKIKKNNIIESKILFIYDKVLWGKEISQKLFIDSLRIIFKVFTCCYKKPFNKWLNFFSNLPLKNAFILIRI